MKYLLLFFLFVSGAALPAQSATKHSSTSVAESVTNEKYSFRLRVDLQQMPDLTAAYIKLAEITGISKITGISSFTTDAGAIMQMNTKKRTLRIYSDKKKPASIASAQGLADLVREELNLAPAPAPPGN